MKCSEARKIMNVILDGGEHRDFEEALVHNSVCGDCCEWFLSMQSAIGMIEASRDGMPEVDFVGSIATKLSEKAPEKSNIGRLVKAIAVTWLSGSVIVIALIVLARNMLGDSINYWPLERINETVTGWTASLVGYFIYAADVTGSILKAIYDVISSAPSIFAGLIVIELIVFALLLFAWRRSKYLGITTGIAV